MTHAFEMINVEKSYADFHLGPLNLHLEPGTVLGYIGPNGSGKTTTMHCLVGLVKAEAGEMRIHGQPNDPNKTEWKLNIGYVGDQHVFYENWSAAKNLKFLSQFYPDWSNDLMLNLVKRFKLPMDKKAKALSSGNRVKLSVISALSHSPKVLLLDEPTAGLDPVVRAELLDVLFDVLESGERAIFYSTHILSDISRLADELVFLNDGQIIQRSEKDDLVDQWRQITCQLANSDIALEAAIEIVCDGKDFKIISSNGEVTLKQLRELGASKITESRLSINEIAVYILKQAS
ncbi:ABC transporter ATP-binding protein [candidate division KSB1 bacterium]|nr:ABC transporter ATP-binding protein [candidate division KSB1 bacterium]